MEIWKDIAGFEGLYKISNYGRVWSETWKIIRSPTKDKDGYYQLGLSKNGKKTFHKIHRLVAQTFLQNPRLLSDVNHKNEDKTDNKIENLEWCTRAYNNAYGSKVREVLQVDLSGRVIKKHNSVSAAARAIGQDRGSVAGCCRGRRTTVGGYKWTYDRPVT